ncbi:MAG TPA: carbohydrate kinase family protein [bacterium]|nr:carbohydrate kinase family protein [bacterium]
MPSYDIVTIGDATEDVFVWPELRVQSMKGLGSGKAICFEFGEKIALDDVQYEIGGSACNVAVGLSRLGYKAGIITALGKDTVRDRVIDRLQVEDVDVSNITVNDKIKSGFSVIFSMNGDRTIFVYHGIKDYRAIELPKQVSTEWYFVTPLGEETEAIEKYLIAEASEHGIKIAWNPGSKQILKGASHFRALLKCTTVLFLNREEAIKFTDFQVKPRIEEVMEKLANMGPKIVVVTNGKEGARAYDGVNYYDVFTNQRIERVDATGAGDSFAVGVLGRIMQEKNLSEIEPTVLKEALSWGKNNSESVIRYVGAQRGLLTRAQIV